MLLKIYFLRLICVLLLLLSITACDARNSKVLCSTNSDELTKLVDLKIVIENCEWKNWSSDITHSFLIPSLSENYIAGNIVLSEESYEEFYKRFDDWNTFKLNSNLDYLSINPKAIEYANVSIPNGDWLISKKLQQELLEITLYGAGIMLLNRENKTLFFILHTV